MNYASEIINVTRTYSGLKNKECDLRAPEIIKHAYREDVLKIRGTHAWAGLWQFYQMANVVQRVIRGLHPRIHRMTKKGQALHDDSFHTRLNLERSFCPHGYDMDIIQPPLGIMWTKPTAEIGVVFNHFVPIVR